ncbi:predicted protein [Cyanophage PSS2]|uniref:hypothetical protein n=1 Tax=Cyanophage PSS2 TaxID=658401 RepID=UPI0001B0401C|nr:hypothetical protein PSS2_gp070 [Cyanophage PSS2]ACT65632.1 hypothetical protein [Cyanophage PSS2]ACY75774.1 predicted protein [Cyanophage PSS2]
MSCRLPIKPARGTLGALQAKVADLEENEIVYATDASSLYVKRSGVLVAINASTNDAQDALITALTLRIEQLEADMAIHNANEYFEAE